MNARNVFLLLSAVSCVALAQQEPAAADLQPKTENGITYLCGGVGLDESTAMKQAARDYDLMSTFAAQDGSYLADVKVEILDKGGAPILQTTCSGPIMLVKMSHAGSYRIRVALDGHAQTKTAQLPSGHGTRRLVFVWPAAQAGLKQDSVRRDNVAPQSTPGS